MKEACARILVITILVLGFGLWLYPSVSPTSAPQPIASETSPTWADAAWAFSKVALAFLPGLFVVAVGVAIISAPFLVWRHLRNRHEVEKLRALRELPEGVTHLTQPRYTLHPPRFTPTPAPVIDAPAERPLPILQWFPQIVNHDGHVLLLGTTGSGKSTLARAIMAARAEMDKLVIIDPHADRSAWAGLPAYGLGRNLDDAEHACRLLHAEFERRFQPDVADVDRLTCIIDEFPVLASERKDVVGLVVKWLREARKKGIRIILLSQGWEVKALGIEGEGSIRENFLTVRLGAFATEVMPDAAHLDFPAVLLRGNSKAAPRLIDTTGLPSMVQETLPAEATWQPHLALPTTTRQSLPNGHQEREDRRRRILELDAAGMKITNIAIEVYGHDGGGAIRKVKAVLAEEGRV